MIAITLDHVRLVNPLNGSHGHWSGRAKRAKLQRGAAMLATRSALGTLRLDGLLVVTITRISPGTLDDDALPASGKHVRDGVADALGVKDNDPRIAWRYAAEKRGRGVWGVRIEIQRREAA